MADEGTLATTAQVLLAIGANPSTAQALEANTNYWIKFAESEMSTTINNDLVTNYSSITAGYRQYLATVAAARAAFHAIQQDQDNWSLSTTQSKLNVIDAIWKGWLSFAADDNKKALLGISNEA